MSRKNLTMFLQAIQNSPILAARFNRPFSYSDFCAIARDHGFEISDLDKQEATQIIQESEASSLTPVPWQLVCSPWSVAS